jgi:branched-chain amino acid transport system substrate-binding protein
MRPDLSITRRELGRVGVSSASVALSAGGVLSLAQSAAAQAKQPVKIGVILGLTGPAAKSCIDCLNAIKLALREINQAGGVLGRPIELIVEDDEGRPNQGAQAANKLADVDKVPLVIGAYQSSVAMPVAKVLNGKGVVFVTVATTNDIKNVGSYVFDTAGQADQEVALVDFVKVDNPKAKTVAGFFPNNAVGQDFGRLVKTRAAQIGLEHVSGILYQVGAKDFRADLSQLMETKPDATVIIEYSNDAEIIQRQLYEMGLTDFGSFYQENLGVFLGLDPKLTEGMKGIDYATYGLHADEYTKKYIAAYGKRESDAWAAAFYDGMWIAALAINGANSLDPKAIRNAMWLAAYNFQGVSSNGDKGFNMLGMQPTDTTYPLVMQGGKMEPYNKMGSGEKMVVFRNQGEEGVTLQFAPSEEALKKLHPQDP